MAVRRQRGMKWESEGARKNEEGQEMTEVRKKRKGRRGRHAIGRGLPRS